MALRFLRMRTTFSHCSSAGIPISKVVCESLVALKGTGIISTRSGSLVNTSVVARTTPATFHAGMLLRMR